MSMSTHVKGFRPPDAKWEQMKSVCDACKKAKVAPPQEVEEFFGYESPEEKPGMTVEIDDAVTLYQAESEEGYDVDITKLPPGVTIVRVYNSY